LISIAAAGNTSDARLIKACRAGDQRAWATLVDRYKRLIYSIPFRYHFSPEDCADVFQAVCLELFSELDEIRSPDALRSWLMTVTSRKCQEWIERYSLPPQSESAEAVEQVTEPGRNIAEILHEAARDQDIREAIDQLQPRCQELIRLLFFSQPPQPYDAIAQRLGLATGSIGFIRGRCLQRLKNLLEERGL
jgi:RNA polymerase sigma factor (sigma-70 family)